MLGSLKLKPSRLLFLPSFPNSNTTINNQHSQRAQLFSQWPPSVHPISHIASVSPYHSQNPPSIRNPILQPSQPVHEHVPWTQFEASPSTYFIIPPACLSIFLRQHPAAKAHPLTIQFSDISKLGNNNQSSAEMLFSTLAVAIGAFAGAVSAQANFTSCCNVTPTSVEMVTRLSWCRAQQNTCPETCQNGQVSANTCDAVRLLRTLKTLTQQN